MSRRILIWYEGRSEVAVAIAAELARSIRRLQPDAAVTLAFGEHIDHQPEPGIGLYRLPSGAGFQRLKIMRARWQRFKAILAEVRPAVVLIPMNFFSAWPFNRLVRAAGARLAYIVHDPQPHQGDYHPLWQASSQRLLIANSELVITLSAFADRLIRERHPALAATRLATLPLAALMPAVRTQARTGIPDVVRFLFLGRLLSYKGLDILRAATARLQGRDDWRLTIAGQGPLDAQARELFAGDPHVDLSSIGNLPAAQFRSLVAAHDIMLCPYREATQSGIVCDAMADAMPVIATPVGALPEQVGQGGIITHAVDAEALADALAAVLDDKAMLPQLSARALATHKQRQNHMALAELIDRLFRLSS